MRKAIAESAQVSPHLNLAASRHCGGGRLAQTSLYTVANAEATSRPATKEEPPNARDGTCSRQASQPIRDLAYQPRLKAAAQARSFPCQRRCGNDLRPRRPRPRRITSMPSGARRWSCLSGTGSIFPRTRVFRLCAAPTVPSSPSTAIATSAGCGRTIVAGVLAGGSARRSCHGVGELSRGHRQPVRRGDA
jgi:hypothetical protein